MGVHQGGRARRGAPVSAARGARAAQIARAGA